MSASVHVCLLPASRFADFFDTPRESSAAPEALGFDGFYKGAYSYHFHNFWCVLFFPNLITEVDLDVVSQVEAIRP